MSGNNFLPFERIKREVFVRKDAETDFKFGSNPDARPTEELINFGIINVDKPRGPTSHQVSAYLQKILKIKKAGHSGTLDPNVTGVLPTATGRATRIVETLLKSGKEYICIMHLHKPVDEELLKETFKEFTGKIKQLPPLKSAVKREERYRKVYYIEVLDIVGQDVLFIIGCQAGTYIRKICHDIGVRLGTGANMAELRRTKAGPFNESTLCTLNDLTDAYHYYKNEGNDKYLRKLIQPIEKGAEHLPKVWVFDTTVDTLCHGADLKTPGISKVESDIQIDDKIAILTLKGELVAIGPAKMISKDMVKQEKGLAVVVEKVFMLPGTYPKITRRV
jgi:H/ACA ribonucleoprotein complex subunit 4